MTMYKATEGVTSHSKESHSPWSLTTMKYN